MSTRKFAGTPGEMLTVAKTMAENLKEYIDLFTLIKSDINKDYLNSLKQRIDNVADKYLGKNKLAEQTKISQTLYSKVKEAKKNIAVLRIFINTQFNTESKEMLKTLGYNKNKIVNNDQQAIFTFLQAIKSGITTDLEKKFTDKKLNPKVLASLKSLGTEISDLDAKQEAEKSNSKANTEAANTAFNEIHTEIMFLSKVAPKLIEDAEVAKSKFGYTFLLRQLSGSVSKLNKKVKKQAGNAN